MIKITRLIDASMDEEFRPNLFTRLTDLDQETPVEVDGNPYWPVFMHIHQDPAFPDLGSVFWSLSVEGAHLYFNNRVHAARVFMMLYSREPDVTELQPINLIEVDPA